VKEREGGGLGRPWAKAQGEGEVACWAGGGWRPKREEGRSGPRRGGETGPRLGQKVSRAEFQRK
jgi:hypothetical protein